MNPITGAGAITGPLTIGSRGPSVRTLQEVLNRTTPSPGLHVDGAFGLKTDAAVRAFQRSKNLKPDGIVGPRTAAALGLRYTAAAPAPQPPGRPRPALENPVVPPTQDPSAIAQLVEAVIQGLSEIHNNVLNIFHALDDLPDVVLTEIRGLLSGPLHAAVAALREGSRIAKAGSAAAARVIEAAVRAAAQKLISALQACLSVLSRLPDILGLTGVADKIRSIIVKLQRAVESVIDTILRTLLGAGQAVGEAVFSILGTLRQVAAAAA